MNELSLFSLENKVAVLTGGYGHLGQAMAQALLRAGALTVVGGRSLAKFNAAFQGLQNVYFYELDVSSTKSIKTFFSLVTEHHSKIDVLVNNAFYVRGKSPETLSDEDWNHSIDGVLSNYFRCLREVIPILKKQGSGSIVNIASIYGMVSPDFKIYECNDFLNPPHYGSAKAAVIQLTRYYAMYLAQYQLRVNCISPGPFPSREVQQKDPPFIESLSQKCPLGRIGQPSDLQGALIYLASDASSYVTGHNLVVDGGWTIL